MENLERQSLEVDIACVGFGPAMGGFLTTLSKVADPSLLQSRVMPGMPLQIMCYERADDVGFGVSGIVTRGRGIRASFPELDLSSIPMAHPVKHEKLVYLLDPIGASRRSAALKLVDKLLPARHSAFEIPFIPAFLRKDEGMVLSIGQFTQWISSQVMATGMVQLWPGTPVQSALIEGNQVAGVRLCDQGVEKDGSPSAGYMPGMDVRAALTVVGDGPVGAVGQQLDQVFGMPEGHHKRDWAVGMKMVVDLPENTELEAGMVYHTLGFPEPEIFGFLYVHPNRGASFGIFVPSFLETPVRTSYRYLQHWMLHPYFWRHLKGAKLRSWGAKSLSESGKHGEPFLAGNGYARIGEGSGSTNVLSGSGVDEAWTTGAQLAEGVLDLLREGKPFTKETLHEAYVARRRKSWVEKEAAVAEKARDGFHQGFSCGLLGMGLTGLTKGLLNIPGVAKRPHEKFPSLEEHYGTKLSAAELEGIRKRAAAESIPLHDLLMNQAGWPEIPYDGTLLVSHQDALLMGGKVQAAPGYADHVVFTHPEICETCIEKTCISICSGQAIMPGEASGVPRFDREKCVHCGACLWNCSKPGRENPEFGNLEFRAGAGGLHSSEN
ncbi:MAG: 4Fe-4S ferredoxin [Bdellovibrionales bacterium RIFOXYD1_FULL_55_31]|nr:MAG: 4Fe-4S ferredoxin [Bdellovibrionales bacterium RIFOXYD1_FULL_55_31]